MFYDGYIVLTGIGIDYQEATRNLAIEVEKMMREFKGWRPLGGVSASNDLCIDRVDYYPGRYYASQAMYLTEKTRDEDLERLKIREEEKEKNRIERELFREKYNR